MWSKRLSTDKEKDLWSVLWLQTRKFDPKKYGNFMFRNVAGFQNYGYTDQTHVQQQNTQSSSRFQDYWYNNQTQPLQWYNQPLQAPQTPQDPYSLSPCNSNNSGWDE